MNSSKANVRAEMPRRSHRLRFSAKVMLYLLTAYVILAVLFGSMYYINARQTTENRVIAEISHSLDRTANDLENMISQTENVYLNLLFDQDLFDLLISYKSGKLSHPQTLTKITPILQGSFRNLDFVNAVYLLNDDYVFYNSNRTYTSTLNVFKSASYLRAQVSEQPFWTSAYDFTAEYGHVLLADKSLPISNRNLVSYMGRFNGVHNSGSVLTMWPSHLKRPVVCINISVDELVNTLSSMHGVHDRDSFILDPQGMYLAHTDVEQLYASMDPDIFSRLNEASGTISAEYEGESSLLLHTRLSNGWTLCSAVSRSEIFGEIYSVIWTTLIGMLLGALVLCILLALVVSRQLSLPIKQLLQAINITGAGNFMVNLPRTGDEFDAVHTAFNDMTHRIDALIHENYEAKLRERENELRALKYQTKPHFLYNALTIIRTRAMKNGDAEAADMIQNLSNVLRYVLRGDQNLATVREEINNVTDYFDLMRAGYEDAISLELDVDPGMLNAAICKMTLQPLVENCVQHGINNLPGIGRVRITGRIVGNSVSLIVSDNGPGWPEGFTVSDDEHQTESIGLANVKRRMKLIFGDRCQFRLFSPPEGGAAVEIVFPYQFGTNSTT